MIQKNDRMQCLKCGICKPESPVSCISKLVKIERNEIENINCRVCSQLCPVSCIGAV